jgi:hypothetical protein
LKVYKYLPFSDGSKCILSDGTMKFSHHSDFNDPFDCKATYDIEESMQYVRSNKEIFNGARRDLGLSPAALIQKKNKMLFGMKKSLENGTFHSGLIDDVGICSLSKKPDNILMWSHYADNHRGFVVEFTIQHHDPYETHLESVCQKLIGWEVEYSEEMPVIIAG